MKVTDDILYVGVDDHEVDLFEGQYQVPGGMAYNSYVILDERIAVMDTATLNVMNGVTYTLYVIGLAYQFPALKLLALESDLVY